MKHLVIGGCGFIGSNLATYLNSLGEEVTVLDNLSRVGSEINLRWLEKMGVKSIRADVLEQDIFNPEDFDVIYMLAGQTAVTHSVENPRHDFMVNVTGVFNVLETIRKSVKKPRLVFASTNKVYGHLQINQPCDESTPLDFYTPYGCSKGTADQYIRDYARIFDLCTTVLRQSCIYGHRQWGTEDQGWLAWFALRILQEKEITIFGDGSQVRDLLYISDLVELYYKIASAPKEIVQGKIYNVGGGLENSRSLSEAIYEINKYTGKNPKLIFAPERPGDQPYFVSDNTKLKKELSWEPKINVNQGLLKLLTWLEKGAIPYYNQKQ
ncbi:MAG TPA: GDP-mannose 4,6-dehydratase [bacterium]|nr:GDP-mannose 4,6-dehydratase [bacterium]